MQSHFPWPRPWMLAPWRCLALVGGVLAVHQVRGWPGPCAPLGTAAACAVFLAAISLEIVLYYFGVIWLADLEHIAIQAANALVTVLHVVLLLAAVRGRRELADALECLRLYGARRVLRAQGVAATLALASLVLLHATIFTCYTVAFASVSVPFLGPARTAIVFGLLLLQQMQWSVAFVLMLYPMVVVGSLSADLRRDCSQTAALRVRRSTSSPDEQRLAPHVWRELRLRQHILHNIGYTNIRTHQEHVVLVVAGALVSPSMYLSHSLWELSRSGTTMTALMSAVVGLHYFMDLTVFSFSCQWFFYESAAIKQVLHGFLVETGSLNSQETREVRAFIQQIDRQQNFSIWGLFEIDKKFTATIILAATSHIAVLVQAQATFF
ncbi:DNA replication and repair protein RecF [Frankliniella fusca]|uniref:Gustatory receptor n=1 Tax=Frankliniella fusca TaxID=407009 RepID=A0AAE1HJS8_9NEOP|nr:DNA replication and repair protein RecF [Frankliniella fusca]